MNLQYKTSHRIYPAWNYEKETEDLNKESENGWQLVRGGCFYSRFVKNPNIRYRYQLDFGKIEDLGRYIEIFREQGWEYVNSTFNGWHFLRKLYDPKLPKESYEIYTDRQSKNEMNRRWAKIASFLSVLLGILAVINLIRFIREPHIPVLIQFATFAIEFSVLFFGAISMRNPDKSRNKQNSGKFMAAFLIIILAGCFFSIFLTERRTHLQTSQYAEEISKPVVKSAITDFYVYYADNYFLDLDTQSEKPLTFEIVSEAGEILYRVSDTGIQLDDARVRLSKGSYHVTVSCDSGYRVEFSMH